MLVRCSDLVVDMQHPYTHNMLALLASFVLTYRSQLAYQRFWEARTMLQQMSARWVDAATQVPGIGHTALGTQQQHSAHSTSCILDDSMIAAGATGIRV